jgi:hypothetical protein
MLQPHADMTPAARTGSAAYVLPAVTTSARKECG